MSAEKIKKDWEAGNFAPVYLFYGQEDFLIEQLCVSAKKHALKPGDEDFNLDVLHGNEVDGVRIVNIACSYPMMAERRVVLVKGIQHLSQQSLELLLKYILNPLSSTCLLLTADKIDSRNKLLAQIRNHTVYFQSKPMYDNAVPNWIRTFVKESHLAISDEAVRMLQAYAGNAMRNLSMEIEKIVINIGERRLIEAEDVEKVVGVSRQYNIFELCDAIGFSNIKSGLAILNHMLQQGESATGILAMLGRHFFILSKLKELTARRTPDNEIAKELRIHPFFLQNYKKQAACYSREQLREAFSHLLETDYRLKTSYQKPKMVLEMLLFRLNSHAKSQ